MKHCIIELKNDRQINTNAIMFGPQFKESKLKKIVITQGIKVVEDTALNTHSELCDPN